MPAFIALVAVSIAQATGAPTIKTSLSSPHPSQVITLTASGFGASEPVDIYIDTTDTLLLVSSASGTLSAPLTVPASAMPGTHYVTAIGRKIGDSAQAKLTVTTPWANPGFGLAQQGNNPYENVVNASNVSSLGALWRAPVTSTGATPIVGSGKVFAGTRAGLVALSTKTGTVLWTAAKSEVFMGAATLADGNIYAQGANVYSFVAATGAVRWTSKLSGSAYGSAAVANGLVYIGAGNDLYALNASTGATIWIFTTGGRISSTPAIVSGVVYVGSSDDNFYAIDAMSGQEIWHYTASAAITVSAAVANGVAYLSSGAMVYAVKTNGVNAGSLLWNYMASDLVYTPPTVANGQVYIGSADGMISSLGAQTGAVTWSVRKNNLFTGLIVVNGVIYASSIDTLYAFAAENGNLLASAVTGSTDPGYTPSISDGILYISAVGSNTYAFALQAGMDVIARPKASSLHPDLKLNITH